MEDYHGATCISCGHVFADGTQAAAGAADNPATDTDTETATDAPTAVPDVPWDYHPALSAIRRHAHAHIVGPVSVLVAALQRITAATPPEVVRPPLGRGRRGHRSLNMFVALAGSAGMGKDVAMDAAEEAIEIKFPEGRGIADIGFGSGEGFLDALVEKDTDPQTEEEVQFPARMTPVFTVPDVDALIAVMYENKADKNKGLLLSAWNGKTLDQRYRGKPAHVPAHTYRMGLLVGVQPLRARKLIEDTASGFSHRFVWASVAAPPGDYRPDYDPGDPYAWTMPALPDPDDSGLRPMTRDEAINEIVYRHGADVRTGAITVENPHGMQVRLNIAEALALLFGTTHVDMPTWEIAGIVAAHSDATVRAIQSALDADEKRDDEERSRKAAVRIVATNENVMSEKAKRAAAAVIRKLERSGDSATGVEITRAVRIYRDILGEVLVMLELSRQITREEFTANNGNQGVRYHLAR